MNYRFQGADRKYFYVILEKDNVEVEVAIKNNSIEGDLFQSDDENENGEVARSEYIEENFDALYNSANPLAQHAYIKRVEEALTKAEARNARLLARLEEKAVISRDDKAYIEASDTELRE